MFSPGWQKLLFFYHYTIRVGFLISNPGLGFRLGILYVLSSKGDMLIEVLSNEMEK